MEYEEFLKIIMSQSGLNIFVGDEHNRKGYNRKKDVWDKSEPEPKNKDLIFKTYLVSGESGGSCWGGKKRPVTPEPEPKVEELKLKEILLHFCPNLSLSHYFDLNEKIIHVEDLIQETEYYGNWSQYRIKYIDLRELYDYFLKVSAFDNK